MERTRITADMGIANLVRQMADDFVTLIIAHFRVSNLELTADLRARANEGARFLAIGLVALIGYLLLMVGIALGLDTTLGRPSAFGLLGILHLAVAATAGLVASQRRRRAQSTEIIGALTRSLTNVAGAVTGPGVVS